MKRIFTLIALFVFAQQLSAQENWYRSKDNAYYWKNRKPFEGYWQQDVHYKIKAQVSDKDDIVDASEELTYYNNSNDTLYFVYFHLYQNAFVKGSYLEQLNLANNFKQKFGKYEAQGKGTEVESVKVNGASTTMSLDNTILKVMLPAPLMPNSSVFFAIKFKTYFDADGTQRRRMKMFKDNWGNKQYDGVHWYPRICVYDRKFGWETDQHLGKEFYGDFGSYDVELSLPNNYVLDATGELQNRAEVLPDDLRAKLDVSNFKDKAWDEKPSTIIEANGTFKTWKFHADNVHDFAWVADPTFRIGEVELTLPQDNNRKIKCVSLAQEPHARGWQDAATFTAKVIDVYSRDIGVYAYPKMIVADARDGMEYPMLTLDGGSSPGYYGLLAHEVGHNWFFGMVGNNETYRASLDEGFTQFLTHWSMSRLTGEEPKVRSKSKYINKYSRPLAQREQTNYLGYIRDAINNDDPQLNTHSDDFGGALGHGGGYGHVYYKTATMLYNLQYVLGDEMFLGAMQHYFNQWKIAHPYYEDFRASIIQYSKTDLNWFFDQWVETTKTIDYSLECVKKAKYEAILLNPPHGSYQTYNITFKRKGEMQMPLDFTIKTKDSAFKFLIPNTYYAKKFDGTVLPTWKGWSLLNQTYTAKVYLPSNAKIKDIVIDPSYRLADVNLLDNSLKCPVLFTFDHQLKNPLDRKHYILKWRPDVWFNNYDGLKMGVHFNGNYMNQKHVFRFTAWYNSGILSNVDFDKYKDKAIYPASYAFSYQHRIAKFTDVQLQSRLLDGLLLNKIGIEKTSDNNTFRIFAKSMRRLALYYLPAYQNINIENTLVLPNLSAFDGWNNTINAEFEHRYACKAGNGSAMIGLRSTALYSTFDYTSLYAQILHHKDLGKLEFRSRLFAQYMTGTNAAPESQLYLAGGNAEEMVESKFSRAAGIIPADWFSYGSSSNHFHSQGGLNIRGYAGYLVPVIDGNNQYLAYRGNSGASVNLEMDFDQFFPIPARGIFRPFHMDTYVFADAGILQSNSSFIADLQSTGKAFTTPLMASSGLGAALTIKRWGKLDDIKPLTIRFDMPMYLSNAPYVDGDNFKFRWMMGISRAF